MKLTIRSLVLLAIAATCSTVVASGTMSDLELQGTVLQLSGDFNGAKSIEQQLINDYDEPVGHVFALNTIVTHLTWDETQTQYDQELINHARETLSWCEPRTGTAELSTKANFYCGQAQFALAYYHGLRGNYFQAGKRGTTSIDYLETALAQDPSLTDAKMHLGVAYHVADNLPPFIKMFSRFLWFIPTGNSEKSLPYLLDVIDHGKLYNNVARYIYSTLLIADESLQPEAVAQLEKLVTLYPDNARFQLRYISLLMMQENYDATLAAISGYLDSESRPVEPDLSLAKIWQVRAYLGLGKTELAQQIFSEIDPLFSNSRDQLPGWSIAWHILTDAQLHDLANQRAEAQAAYAEILSIAKSTYVSEVIKDAARNGLTTPYRLTSPH